MAPLMFGALLVLVLAIVFSEIADGGIDAKAIAMLGVLSALGAALRPWGPARRESRRCSSPWSSPGGCSARDSASCSGCTTLFASALLTSGVGPWMPYQMFGCAWVGLFAGLLPRPPVGGRS